MTSDGRSDPKQRIIESSSIYPLRDFKNMTGLCDAAMRAARRQGLQVVRVGRNKFVRGSDFHKYLGQAKASDSAGGSN